MWSLKALSSRSYVKNARSSHTHQLYLFCSKQMPALTDSWCSTAGVNAWQWRHWGWPAGAM